MLWCDIDRFKVVNDTHGHAAGDAVLKALAERIRGCLRSTDDIGARIGGDEMLILLNGVSDLQDAADVAEKLRSRAVEPIPTAAGPITVTLSIGVTLASPDETIDALLARADDAMYEAKNVGETRWWPSRSGPTALRHDRHVLRWHRTTTSAPLAASRMSFALVID